MNSERICEMKKTRSRLSCSLFYMCSNFVIFIMVLRGEIKGIHKFRDKYLLVLPNVFIFGT